MVQKESSLELGGDDFFVGWKMSGGLEGQVNWGGIVMIGALKAAACLVVI